MAPVPESASHPLPGATRPVLVTGSAGFIGSHVCARLLARGARVVGFDNLCDYYDVSLKRTRLGRFLHAPGYTHVHGDIGDRAAVEALFARYRPEAVVHLAAQAGVRHASLDPHTYVSTNVDGFLHVLESCRAHPVRHLLFASSSSVYGADTALPFNEHQATDHPLNLYAATKKANEAMAHAYAHLYAIPATGLRFFTVYGPWGRPDMSPMLFARAILAGRPIPVFNHGRHRRSFTYIDDIVEGLLRTLDAIPRSDPGWRGDAPDPATSGVAPYRIYNIGHEQPVELLTFIRLLERHLGGRARLELLPMQPGDVPDTEADVSALVAATGYRPTTGIEEGVRRFAAWYRAYARAPEHANAAQAASAPRSRSRAHR